MTTTTTMSTNSRPIGTGEAHTTGYSNLIENEGGLIVELFHQPWTL